MTYLIGDSHATQIYTAWGDELPGLTWKTALGYGLQNFVRDNCRGNAPGDLLLKNLATVPKQEKIILSYTEVDGRIGLGEKGYLTLDADYANAVGLLFQVMDPKEIIFIDWYCVSDTRQSEQKITPEQRVKNRDAQLAALMKCKENWQDRLTISTVRLNPLYENESGFALLWNISDGVHFDFDHETHRKELLPLMKSWID